MKTRIPKLSPPAVTPTPDSRVMEIRHYKLITPLFGGGVDAQQADPITAIRGTSVRGQLRFWWRATRGGQFNGDLKAMRECENAIWGSAAKRDNKLGGPSQVTLTIQVLNEGCPLPATDNKGRNVANIGSPRSVYSYVAFPLRDVPDAMVLQGVEFRLTLCYPNELEADVRAALWAWETFGGIGARTRRGFGALQLVEHWINSEKKPLAPPTATQIEPELRRQLKAHVLDGNWSEGVPHLTHALRMEIAQRSTSPYQVWKDLIGHLQKFRQQDARIDRKTGAPKGQGLSVWPEANALRTRQNQKPKWTENIAKPKKGIDKFPRAAFGLPIPFHLPHDGNKTFTLQGGNSIDRLASRLILKPLPVANGQYVGLAALLHGPSSPPTGLRIKEELPVEQPVEWELTKSEASSEPLNRILDGEPDVIEAFLKYLKK